jgi:hypothetical protein
VHQAQKGRAHQNARQHLPDDHGLVQALKDVGHNLGRQEEVEDFQDVPYAVHHCLLRISFRMSLRVRMPTTLSSWSTTGRWRTSVVRRT